MLFFFGVLDGKLGHDLWCSETERLDPFWIDGVWQFKNKRRITIPWERLDAALCPGKRVYADDDVVGDVHPDNQHEGAYSLHHAEGWTALAWWDRSGRRGFWSNAALIAKGHHSATTMLENGRAAFPKTFARMTYPFKPGRFSRRPRPVMPDLELVIVEQANDKPTALPVIPLARTRYRPPPETQIAFAW